jgi:hypothetical protein
LNGLSARLWIVAEPRGILEPASGIEPLTC